MKSVIFALAALAVTSSVFANAELAKKNNCLACHAVEHRVVGPSFKEVAAKYVLQKDAVAQLTTKIMKGTAGTWGVIPMPANGQVNEADARTLAIWVLSQK